MVTAHVRRISLNYVRLRLFDRQTLHITATHYQCTVTVCFSLPQNSIRIFALTLLVGSHEVHPARKKTEWWGAGVVICLERGADLHMAQLMPLPLTVS